MTTTQNKINSDFDTKGGGMTNLEHDMNLMLVYAIEGYSQRHNIAEKDTAALFRKHGIGALLRKNYNALHTQDLDESVSFAEDVLSCRQN